MKYFLKLKEIILKLNKWYDSKSGTTHLLTAIAVAFLFAKFITKHLVITIIGLVLILGLRILYSFLKKDDKNTKS